MTSSPYPFADVVVEEVRRLGGNVVAGTQGLPLAERVSFVQFPKPLVSEGTVDVMLDELAEAELSGEDAVAALRERDELWNQGVIWQAPGVALADPAIPESARLPLLDLATHYPEVLPSVEEACGVEVREIVHLGFSEGYPNYAFVLADDPNPGDPAVFTTDHEVFFREVESEGSLSEYLGLMLTDESVYQMVRDQLR